MAQNKNSKKFLKKEFEKSRVLQIDNEIDNREYSKRTNDNQQLINPKVPEEVKPVTKPKKRKRKRR